MHLIDVGPCPDALGCIFIVSAIYSDTSLTAAVYNTADLDPAHALQASGMHKPPQGRVINANSGELCIHCGQNLPNVRTNNSAHWSGLFTLTATNLLGLS